MSIDQHRSTTNPIEFADLIWWPCMGFSALTPLTLSSSMVSGDNIKNRLDVLWLSPATHGLKVLKCHRWVCAEVPQGPRSLSCMCSFMMSLDLSTSPYFHVFSGSTLQQCNHFWSANALCTFSPPKAWTGRPGTWSSWAMFANPLDVFTKQHKVSLHQFAGMISTSLYRRSRIKH